jgi:hypothetical protein
MCETHCIRGFVAFLSAAPGSLEKIQAAGFFQIGITGLKPVVTFLVEDESGAHLFR